MRKKKLTEISYVEKLKYLQKAGIIGSIPVASSIIRYDQLESIPQRIEKILQIVKKTKNSETMLYFVMYDIEDNKIRNYIARYLIEKGCVRIQKSVFIASTDRKVYNEISSTLKEVNGMYANNDSILLIPVSTDELRAMYIIGHEIDIKMFTDNPNSLIF